MSIEPEIGEPGGQHYNIVRSIKDVIGLMAGGGIGVAAAVIKELLQNADDAGASKVAVILDERPVPTNSPEEYRQLLGPAILVRNNKPFRIANDPGGNGTDDFKAICDVASGHKLGQATAGGRFGIGFNSTYFLTDTPVLFSRREVHVFDLLHRVPACRNENGLRFPLDKFPKASASAVGSLKNVLAWMFPKEALGTSFESIANFADRHFDEAIVRIPLRITDDGVRSMHPDRFRDESEREKILNEMAEQTAKAMLYLKNVESVTFGKLNRDGIEKRHNVSVTPPPQSFREFLNNVDLLSKVDSLSGSEEDAKPECKFNRTVTWQNHRNDTCNWNYWVWHLANFADDELRALREHLRKNDERAIPWGAIAIPTDVSSLSFDGDIPAWRVLLPLQELGPSTCVFHAAFFPERSRRRTEFQDSGSDEAVRKTKWNTALVEKVLVPLLVDSSADLPELIPNLITDHPKLYLSLFPRLSGGTALDSPLSEHFRQHFADQPCRLLLFDIWDDRDNPIEWLVKDEESSLSIEMIPEALLNYRDQFNTLSNDTRRFVKWSVGDALWKRISTSDQSKIRREPGIDVVHAILSSSAEPQPADIKDLLNRLAGDTELDADTLDGLWCFGTSADGKLQKYSRDELYLVSAGESDAGIHKSIDNLNLGFDRTEWVKHDVGLPAVLIGRRRAIENLVPADAAGALRRLSRVKNARHDILAQSRLATPIVDFLVTQSIKQLGAQQLRLAILVRTANHQDNRRRFRTILLKPDNASVDETAIWENLFRPILAQADAECARELHRLLNHHPDLIDNLNDDDCRVVIASIGNAFEIVRHVMSADSGFAALLKDEVNRPRQTRLQSDELRCAAAALVREAAFKWDQLSPEHQETALALPIHRTSDGRYVALIGAGIGDKTTITQRFRIQSNDDISDAPIKLADCCLLDSADQSAKRFYREVLRIDPHGRTKVLKDVLEQIGSVDGQNISMLKYLAQYLHERLEHLAESTNQVEREAAADLQKRSIEANSVPCIGGKWRAASDSRGAWEVARHLESQGWQRASVASLLPKLFPEVAIVVLDEQSRKLLQRVHPGLEHLDARDIANRAVVSESEGLDLVDRLKLICDNRNDLSEASKPSVCVSAFQVPTVCGAEQTHTVSQAKIRATKSLSNDLQKRLAPETVDIASLASQVGKRFGLATDDQQKIQKKLPDLLLDLGVAKLDESGLKQRISDNFGTIWPTLNDDLRLELLDRIHAHKLTEDLHQLAIELPTVQVRPIQGNESKWVCPTAIISPSWVNSKPPCVLPEACSDIASIEDSVISVWDSWCGINGFESVLNSVLSAAADKRTRLSETVRQIYQWLDRVHGSKLVEREELVATLRVLPWVLAIRTGKSELRCPTEILIHDGEAVLSREFWVRHADVTLPKCFIKSEIQKDLGFPTELPATADAIQKIARCLEYSVNADRKATIAVYLGLGVLLDAVQDLKSIWWQAAKEHAVFRLFRDDNDRVVSALAVFVGDDAYCEDFGELLFCLKATALKPMREVVSIFKNLLIPDRPEPDQLVSALSRLEGQVGRHRKTYHGLLDALMGCSNDPADLQSDALRTIRLATCAGTFQPVSECYWNEDFGDSKKLDPQSRDKVIDATDPKTRQLVERLIRLVPGTIRSLTSEAAATLSPEPRPVDETSAMRELLEPWRNWLAALADPDSTIRDEAQSAGFAIPDKEVRIVAIDRISLCYRSPNGHRIQQSTEWAGPVAFRLDRECVFVRADQLTHDLATNSDGLEELDRTIREQVVGLIWNGEVERTIDRQSAIQFIEERVPRPSVELKRLQRNIEQHHLFQYYDQAADPDFAQLYDEFARTKEKSPRHEELKAKLRTIVANKFGTMRRDQIRAYGYDEFSVFAELVQNAEDAYFQRHELGMDEPSQWSVAFRFTNQNGNSTLSVEHYGRPFNCWRHGNTSVDRFRKDVEGVLRSSGSFKPRGQDKESTSQVIGRFGLGFKSVYLLTDCPSIFSGGWNFRIENGCLPEVVPRPHDLLPEATRIILPLTDPNHELHHADGEHIVCLLPFLSQIKEISITHSDGISAKATRSVSELQPSPPNGIVAELATYSVTENGNSREVQIIRIRNTQHNGQLAMLLASDGLPTPWDDAFTRNGEQRQPTACDFYSALPLKSELGCGVAVSHQFDLQSGRTHLVHSAMNFQRAEQLADLLVGLTDAIPILMNRQQQNSEYLLRFWNVWRWEKGDTETKPIREQFAKQLVQLCRSSRIVPTTDIATAVALSEQPLFVVDGIPQPVVDTLVQCEFCIGDSGAPLPALTNGNILAPGFVRAYRRLRHFTRVQTKDWLDVDWGVIGTTCQNSPWLATHPTILNAIAETATEETHLEIIAWMTDCQFRGLDGKGQTVYAVACDLLLESDDVRNFLPRRLLQLFDASAYSLKSIDFLKMALLSDLPSSDVVFTIMDTQDLSREEAVGALRFVQKEKRWRKYDDIQEQFQRRWFPTPQGRISVGEAANAFLIEADALADAEFRAWLGIGSSPPLPPPLQMREPTAQSILFGLHTWWQEEGAEWEKAFERRTYAFGQAPKLSLAPDLKDQPQRREWLSLMLLGACHTIGRAKPEQHKGFLQLCHQNNWLDTFAARETTAEEWMALLESYLDRPQGEIKYYQWAKLFVPIFQLSRWLDSYVTQARSMNRKERFALDQIFAPRIDVRAGGGGRDAPSSNRALGIGACFVTRELCRLGIVTSPFAHEHCYVPSARVRDLLETIADDRLFMDKETPPQRSVQIFQFLSRAFGDNGEELARFRIERDGPTERFGFDLPLIALCEKDDLRRKLFGRDVIIRDESEGIP